MAEQLYAQDFSLLAISSRQGLSTSDKELRIPSINEFQKMFANDQNSQEGDDLSDPIEIVDLPVEVLEKICSSVDSAEALSNLRLTCSHIAMIGLRYLVPKVTILQTHSSLDRLTEIANHPILQRRVFEVDVVLATIPFYDRSKPTYSLASNHETALLGPLAPFFQQSDDTNVLRPLRFSHRVTQDQRREVSLRERDVFKDAIPKLSCLQSFNFVHLEFPTLERASLRWPFSACRGPRMSSFPALRYKFEAYRVCQILTTLKGHRPASLKLVFEEFNSLQVINAVTETSRILNQPLKIASGLVIRNEKPLLHDTRRMQGPVKALFHALPNMQHFELYNKPCEFSHGSSCGITVPLDGSVNHCLASLRLAAVQVLPKDLMRFISASLILKELRLADIILLESEHKSWKEVIMAIAVTLQLDMVEIGGELLSTCPWIATPRFLSTDHHAIGFEGHMTIGEILGALVCSAHLAPANDNYPKPEWVKQFQSSFILPFKLPMDFAVDVLDNIFDSPQVAQRTMGANVVTYCLNVGRIRHADTLQMLCMALLRLGVLPDKERFEQKILDLSLA